MTDHVLATRYRLPLSLARNSDGAATALDGAQTSGNFGLSFGSTNEYLVGGGGLTDTILQFIMPANYIPGADFAVAVSLVDSENLGDGDEGTKLITLTANSVALNSWDDGAGDIIETDTQFYTTGALTTLTFSSAGAADIATLEPGDLIGIGIRADWTSLGDPSHPIIVNIFVDLDPA